MKKLIALSLLAACAGCSTVQGVTNRYAGKIPGGRTALDAFRKAEGASVGMIDANGKSVQTLAVDKDGVTLTNGVFIRMVIDDEIVAPATSVPAVVPLPNLPPQISAPQAPTGDALDAIGALSTK